MKVLLADDEKAIAVTLGDALRAAGHDVTVVNDGLAAAAAVDASPFDVVVSDIRMPGLDGMAVLGKAKARDPRTEVILVTGYGTVESAVEAMKAGAFHYVQKPFYNEAIVELLGRIAHLRSLRPREEEPVAMEGIVGASREMRQVFDVLRRAAPSEASILIEGESGTGKEMVARALHRNSSRAEGPFVAVNCGAIPRELLEGELFGYERGAFTGAVRSRPGRFEAADGGTLFLDEIGELEPELQVKLLRAIQTREIVRLGSNESRKIDARLLSATNRDLAEEVRAGRFRRDLYYRIRVIEVHLPPLRERVEDIAALADALLQRLADRYGGEPAGITPAALAAIEAYDWPGNVRELENVLERGWILAHGQPLDLNHLPPELRGGVPAPEIPSGLPLEEATDRFRRYYIVRALDAAEGNKTRAADALGVNRSYLFTLLKRYGLSS